MAVLDEDSRTDLTTAEGVDTLWSLPLVVPACEPLDWESLLDQAEARIKEERDRAVVAELRCEELRRAERDACTRVRSLERQLDTCRFKLNAAVAEAKDAASVVSSAPKIGSRAAKALERRVRFLDDEVADLRVTLHRAHEHRERIEARYQDEIDWLKQDLDRGRSRTVKVFRKGERVAESLRKQVRSADRGGQAAGGSPGGHDHVAARAQRSAPGGGRAGHGADRVAAGEECRLRAEVRDLTDENAALASRVETMQAQLDKLRSTRSVLSKALYGSKSERQKKPGTGRKRGQQRGAIGHGRTQRPGLGRRKSAVNRRRMRACVPAAASPMPPTASGAPLSSRSMSRPTRTPSSGRAGAGAASARPRRARWPRLRWCGCSTPRPTGSASGRACSTNASFAAVPCIGSRLGLPTWGWRSRRDAGRQHHALRAAVRTVGQGDPRAPEHRDTAPRRRDDMARSGVSREGALEPGLAVDLREQGPRSTSTSTPRATPRSRSSCSVRPKAP